jgi:hypothetical protein
MTTSFLWLDCFRFGLVIIAIIFSKLGLAVTVTVDTVFNFSILSAINTNFVNTLFVIGNKNYSFIRIQKRQ